jgi:hypothetical protein
MSKNLYSYNKLSSALTRCRDLITRIKGKNFNSEYYVPIYTLYCETIIKELKNRRQKSAQIAIPNRNLYTDLIKNSIIHLFSSICYPAYKGSFYRNLASFLAHINHRFPLL